MGNERELLDSLGLNGWNVVGRNPAPPRKVERPDPLDPRRTVTVDESTGNIIWTVSDGKGHSRQLTVAVSGTGGSSENYHFTVVDPPKDLPNDATTGPARPPEPNVSTTARQIPVWNDATKQWEWKDNPNYTPGGSTQTRPPEPPTNTSAPSIPKWDDTKKDWVWVPNPNYKPPEPKEAPRPSFQIIDTAEGKQLLQINPDGTTTVRQTFPPGLDIRNTQSGGIIAIDPRDPTHPVVIVPDQPKPSTLVPGQSATAGQFIVQKPDGTFDVVPNPTGGQPTEVGGQQGPTILQRMPDGSYRSVPNPAYVNPATQKFQELNDGITAIEGMLTRGELTFDQANQYKQALRANFDAALQGTTPYQQFQDRMARQQARMQSGAGMLNQRVSSGSGLAESLLNSAVGMAGKIRDPSAFIGFTPFAGAFDYVTELGGGPDVYSAAAQAVQAGMAPDPASAMLQAALSAPSGGGRNAGGGGNGSTQPQPVAANWQRADQPITGNGPGLAAPGLTGTVPPGDPRYLGTLADPATALIQAALAQQQQQDDPLSNTGPRLRGPIYG